MCCSPAATGLCGTCTGCPAPGTPLPCGLSSHASSDVAPPLTIDDQDDQESINEKVKNATVPSDVVDVDLSGVVLKNGTGPGKMIRFEDSSAITSPLEHIGKLSLIHI